ncbi:CDP-diacylglycerol--serine O-phosphatidyltransferase [Shewanella avicenniae]|uniref:CDP-diacylglycerol--serine O-phosphatidyltransferase n=1 Tax=Shewanella avicenniae TaxID=2814294 RepID=A0ABX7QKM8_9GAMM|nr:CDP-diacylglycerol--serine O-phosphatidyltransferase [Shewanella avicenniae]QSX32011.1 CDP-diacylglycerol--serine O-phosphatidyltransferase [Shewanella avicenniae]
MLDHLEGIAIAPEAIKWLHTPTKFRETLIERINQAQKCIYIAALYLEDDEAGREILEALLAAKAANPKLNIKVLVDYHRARRGLIGQKGDSGNYRLYRSLMQQAAAPFDIYGIPVKSRELLGVLHLKGFIIDDAVIFSGASLNNVYLQKLGRYRLDRYHLIESAELACAMVDMIDQDILEDDAVVKLTDVNDVRPDKMQLRAFKQRLARANYRFRGVTTGLRVTPLVGLGRKSNKLNSTILDLVKSAESEMFICTPYFNPPYSLSRAISRRLRKGIKIDIVVGDKTANDFYIPPEKPFSTIGALPYLYEQSLRKFMKRQQWAVEKGLLNVHLWKHNDNSFHLKGISVDRKQHLLTGSNLNPRAWALDLENGLLVHDDQQQLQAHFADEQQQLLVHCQRLSHYRELQTLQQYPAPVRKILNRIRRLKADILLRRIL